MTDENKAAEIQWRLIKRQEVSSEEIQFCMRHAIGSHKDSVLKTLDTQDLERLSGYVQSIVSEGELYEKWHDKFESEGGLHQPELNAFLQDCHKYFMECTVGYLSSQLYAGVTIKTEDTASDIQTSRTNGPQSWRMHLTTKGKGNYVINGVSIEAEEGDVVFYGPNANADYRRSSGENEWIHEWVYFLQDETLIPFLNKGKRVADNTYVISLGTETELLSSILGLFREMRISLSNGNEYSTPLAKNLLQQLLIRLAEVNTECTLSTLDERVIKTRNYITLHFSDKFTIDDLAEMVGLSPTRLASLFKKQIGCSIMKWRDEQRMTKSIQLLKEGWPINKIAIELGYSDQFYFSRCFNQRFQCSPSEYRTSVLRT